MGTAPRRRLERNSLAHHEPIPGRLEGGPSRCHFLSVRYLMTRMRSVPDSAIHASLLRPSIWRTSALGRSLGKLSKVSFTGSKRSTELALHSDTHTPSSSSTHTAYACGSGPGGFHSFQEFVPASKSASLPEFHSLTHSRPRESDHTRRVPLSCVGGTKSDTAPVSRSTLAR